tara:strand:- start:89 stop:487 length:399 start_codon:yes stop_codon:yes gene_type:complete
MSDKDRTDRPTFQDNWDNIFGKIGEIAMAKERDEMLQLISLFDEPEEEKAIIKLNGGSGALLCNGCDVILSYGSDHNTETEHYCGDCYGIQGADIDCKLIEWSMMYACLQNMHLYEDPLEEVKELLKQIKIS